MNESGLPSLLQWLRDTIEEIEGMDDQITELIDTNLP